MQDAGVVIQQLGEDITPQPAQPLAVFDHGDSAVGSLVSRIERTRLHACNGSGAGSSRCLLARRQSRGSNAGRGQPGVASQDAPDCCVQGAGRAG